MTTITIYQNHDDPVGFHTSGHAGYAEYGEDIVCAGISALVLNAVNSVEALTDTTFTCTADDNTGSVDFRLTGAAGNDAVLLLRSMILGLQGIQNDYGKKFLRLHFKEV